MSNHQRIDIVRDTATTNGEVDAFATALAAEAAPVAAEAPPLATPADRPDWLPQKFQDPAELAKAYGELEKKLASTGADFSSLDQFSVEFQQNGDLSDASIKQIATLGIPEDIIRAYVDGQKAVLESNVTSVMSLAGGQEQYAGLMEWASGNIPEDEVDAYNAIVDSGNMNTIRMAVAGLKARYEQANGTGARKLIQGDVAGPSGGTYRSVAEIVSAMSDPRYSKDPAYRREVEQRIATSNAFGGSR